MTTQFNMSPSGQNNGNDQNGPFILQPSDESMYNNESQQPTPSTMNTAYASTHYTPQSNMQQGAPYRYDNYAPNYGFGPIQETPGGPLDNNITPGGFNSMEQIQNIWREAGGSENVTIPTDFSPEALNVKRVALMNAVSERELELQQFQYHIDNRKSTMDELDRA
eukprot:UN25571